VDKIAVDRTRPIRATWIAGLLITSMAACAVAQTLNLVANPGFETLTGTMPARWHVFVAPKEGAVGKLSGAAHQGQRAVVLHTPTPYASEPINNWSQNILLELGGKKLKASAAIKVENAQEAALWVQCWQKKPLKVLHVVHTGLEQPLYGSQDWQDVWMEFDVPEGTAFLTLRCVLKGAGTAWFDDIALEEVLPPKVEKKDEEPPFNAPLKPTAERLQTSPPADVETEIARLKQANLVLAEALERMEKAHAALLEELALLRQEMSRQRGGYFPTPGSSGFQRPGATPTQPTPYLNPYGLDWKGLP
jgi:hypothetical protein